MTDRPLVSVVDDDESVREALPELIRQLGFAAAAFGSARAFLASGLAPHTDCLLLDITMPEMSGPELQQELRRLGHEIPTVFITARAEQAVCSELLARGAIACLLKPFSEAALIEAITAALRAR